MFLHSLTIFFSLCIYFKVPQPIDGQNQLDSQTLKIMLNLFKKTLINKIKYSKSSPDPDFLGVISRLKLKKLLTLCWSNETES